MRTPFRNVVDQPSEPVEEWGTEALLAAVDRGDLSDWQTIIAGIRRDPEGPLSDRLAVVLDIAEDSGAVGALRGAVQTIRDQRASADRAAIAEELAVLVAASGLDQGTFARRIGTSRTRLNAYLNGRTLPSALVMLRARRVARACPG